MTTSQLCQLIKTMSHVNILMILKMTSKETDILCTLDQIGKVNEGYQKVKLTVGHVTVLDTV